MQNDPNFFDIFFPLAYHFPNFPRSTDQQEGNLTPNPAICFQMQGRQPNPTTKKTEDCPRRDNFECLWNTLTPPRPSKTKKEVG